MKIAIVIHRFGRNIVGGSENYAMKVAEILSEDYMVDVLTTTAKDYITWENYYEAGEESYKNFKIKRFKVDIERSSYWNRLHDIFLKSKNPRDLPIGFSEEWIKYQGPYSKELFRYLKESSKNNRYDRYIFFTYIYPTTYFGIDFVNKEKTVIVPTFHDEKPLYLPIFQKYKNLFHWFLTNSEKRLAERVYNSKVNGEVIGFGLEDRFHKYKNLKKQDFVIYAGRLEESKGVKELIEYFERFFKKNRQVKLYLIGDGSLKSVKAEGVIYKGFVSEDEKFKLFREAKAFIHPSSYESLGIVLLEAFMMGTAALVNSRSEVLKEHIKLSSAGYPFKDFTEFEMNLNKILNNADKLGDLGRKYFLENYKLSLFKEKIKKI